MLFRQDRLGFRISGWQGQTNSAAENVDFAGGSGPPRREFLRLVL